jgi:hypothetical protein
VRKGTVINKGFASWMNEIEKLVYSTYGFYLEDIPDEDFMVWYENGTTVRNAFAEIIRNNPEM